MRGIRVIIPAAFQSTILQSLHSGHPGITRMKAIARSYLWWNGLDRNIEELANSCDSCQAVKSSPAVAPLHPCAWPDAPWKHLHVDFAGLSLVRHSSSSWTHILSGQKLSQCQVPLRKAPLKCYARYSRAMAFLSR